MGLTQAALEAAAAWLGEPGASAEEAHKTLGLLQQLVAQVQDGLRRVERAQPQQGQTATPLRGESF